MPDHPQSTPPETQDRTPPALTGTERKAQVALLRAAGKLAAVRTQLWIQHARLGELPEDDDMGERRIPDSVRFSVRAAIECTAEDHLGAAIRSLEKAARDTPSELAREWRKHRQERGE